MKKVLVTGAGGFLGSAVTKHLAEREDYETIAVISGRHPVSFPANVRVETADLLDGNSRTDLIKRVKPDVMLHFAWYQVGRDVWYSEENLKWVEASIDLCRLFRQFGGSRLIFAGSHTEYGVGYPGRTEQEIVEKYTLYGICKLAFEQIATCFCEKNDISFASGRYFSVYGPQDYRIVYSALTGAIQDMLKGESFICKAPYNVWDYIYIDDAAEATIRLMESDYFGAINIASGHPIIMKDVFSTVAEIIGRKDLLKIDEESPRYGVCSANTEQMETVLHYRCPTPFREGLERTIQWWRERLAQATDS